MSPTTYLRVLKRQWRSILLATLLGAALGLGLTWLSPTAYTTQRLLLMKAGGATAALDAASQHTITSTQATTLVYYASSVDVRRLTFAATGLGLPALRGSDIKVTVPKDTAYIEVAATAPDATVASRLADAMMSTLQNSSRQFAAGSDRGPALTDVSPKGAAPSVTPTPRLLWALVGAVAAAGLTYVLVLLRFVSNPTLSEADLTDSEIPFLGLIRSRRNGSDLSGEVGGLAGAAGVFGQHDHAPILLVAGVGGGFFDASLSVATSIARTGRRVLLVDGNTTRSGVARLGAPGGAEPPRQSLVASPSVAKSITSSDEQVDIFLLTSDQSKRETVARLIDKWREDNLYDVIIVDVTIAADDQSVWLWLDAADSVLLGGVRDRTPVEEFEKALNIVPRAKLSGTFLLASGAVVAGARHRGPRQAARSLPAA